MSCQRQLLPLSVDSKYALVWVEDVWPNSSFPLSPWNQEATNRRLEKQISSLTRQLLEVIFPR